VPGGSRVAMLVNEASAAPAAVVPGAASSPTSATLYSPSRNISCQMNGGRPGVASYVYGQSMAHPHQRDRASVPRTWSTASSGT
jgi:hypothetical protein